MSFFANKKIILILGCLTIFFPGAFVFGFPGVMAQEWQTLFHVNKAQIGRLMFFILAGTGFSMILAGKFQEKIAGHFIIFIGSLGCGRLSDHYSKQNILMTIFLMASVAYFLMPWFTHLYIISFFACFIGLAFGGLFTVSAPLVTEVFGFENFGIVFGMVFTAYGFFAGFLGPWLSGMILDISGSNFTMVFSLFAVFYLISALLILKVKKVKK